MDIDLKAVIIDFDDTLSLTEPACFVLENEILRRMGREPMSRQIHRENWGIETATAIAERSPGVNVQEFQRLWPQVHKEFIADNQVDVVPDENLEALDRLRELGFETFLLTSRTHAEVSHLMQKSGELAERFANFYYWENMLYHKPDPRAFEHIERDHGLRPSECVYVGDSLGDAISSLGAGLSFVACLESGLRSKEDFKEYDVLAFIDRFADLPQVFA
jgi:phosphoglycolate phosphatase